MEFTIIHTDDGHKYPYFAGPELALNQFLQDWPLTYKFRDVAYLTVENRKNQPQTDEEWEEDLISSTCIYCGGTREFLGTLGTLRHYRCRNCGLGTSQPS